MLQQSQEWASTAVFIQYDDSDGWYDHVTGPIVNPSANKSGTDDNDTNANDSLVPVLPLSPRPRRPSRATSLRRASAVSQAKGLSRRDAAMVPACPFW